MAQAWRIGGRAPKQRAQRRIAARQIPGVDIYHTLLTLDPRPWRLG